jgi:endogenous inhibitor of DNA gyrase (YacG/DUF329 family)
MTNDEKAQVAVLKDKGWGATRIARELGLSENTVKSYLRRHATPVTTSKVHLCPCCGKPVKQTPHRKEKKFCSDACRMKWWNSHQDQIHRKALYEYTCPQCGKSFMAYGNSNRKYCSHTCYIKARFGGDTHDE